MTATNTRNFVFSQNILAISRLIIPGKKYAVGIYFALRLHPKQLGTPDIVNI